MRPFTTARNPVHSLLVPGVAYPLDSNRRSSAAFGRHVVAAALRVADPAAADAAARETDWRKGYLRHFRALVEAGLDGHDRAIAAAGLAAVHDRMRFVQGDAETSLEEALATEPDRPLSTIDIVGTDTAEKELTLPYRGSLLSGTSLHRQLDVWVANGVIEPSCSEAVREVAGNPGWLDLSDQRLVVLGAGAEMGPLPAVLGWGATVVGLDLPQSWDRVRAVPSAGRLIAPAREDVPGADLLTDLPAVAAWLRGIEGRLILGNYVYAPGAAYPLLSAAVDALGVHLGRHRDDLALAFLATPTDVFAVPGEAVTQARARFDARSRRVRLAAAASGGRLLRPNFPYAVSPAINDSLVAQQGPNYALAKRIQRWRATVARADSTVSLSVAPPTRTRSVTSNRLLAAAYAGAHLFDVEVFEPATANKLMAALLVHQIRNPRPPAARVWEEEAFGAVHGGLWRTAYSPRTALPLAAVRGLFA
jgi:hypothetical protein